MAKYTCSVRSNKTNSWQFQFLLGNIENIVRTNFISFLKMRMILRPRMIVRPFCNSNALSDLHPAKDYVFGFTEANVLPL